MVPEETLERAAVDDLSPRYLRKQKPAERRRRRDQWTATQFRRGAILFLLVVGLSAAAGLAADLFLYSPAVLLRPSQVQIYGNHFVSAAELMQAFAPDLGRSILRLPLNKRLATIELIPWVREATIERVWPNGLIVQVVERQPVASISTDKGLKLIDDQGVILDEPPGSRFKLPVVSGIDARMPINERASRVTLFSDLLAQIQSVQSGAASEIIQANLTSLDDVQVTLAGAPVLAGQGPVLVHFGNAGFAGLYRLFLQDFSAWQSKAGAVAAVDLRFNGQAVVTPASPSLQSGAAVAPSNLSAGASRAPAAQANALASRAANEKRSVQQ